MRRKNEHGQALVFTALALTALMGFAGLGVDMGMMRYAKRLQQTAADAAAIAGADDIRYSGGAGTAAAAGNASATNGFTDNAGGVACTDTSSASCVGVVVNHPPKSGPHNGKSNYVEVLVTAEHPNFFMTLLGIKQTTVTARAVATLVGESGTSQGCVFTTGVGISGDITASGTPKLQAPTCGIEDDGGLTANGAPVDINAASVGVTGKYVNHGGGTITPTPVTGIPPVGDPLSFLPQQSLGKGVNWNGTAVPGTTYNGISINGNGTVNFPSGIYYVNGDITVNGKTTVTGTGVTFYVTGNVTINGNSTVQLSAPNSGTWAGVLFDDPSPNVTVKLDGTNTSYFQGALYVPGQGSLLVFGGNNLTNATCTGTSTTNCAQYTIIVADQLELKGNNTLNIGSDYSGLPGGVSIIENAILVE